MFASFLSAEAGWAVGSSMHLFFQRLLGIAARIHQDIRPAPSFPPMGTQPCLSKPSCWLTPFLGVGSPPWVPSILSIEGAASPGTVFIWNSPKIISFAFPTDSSPARSGLQTQGGLSCQHISGCICHAPAALRLCRPFLNSFGGQHCSGSEESSLRILYGIIPHLSSSCYLPSINLSSFLSTQMWLPASVVKLPRKVKLQVYLYSATWRKAKIWLLNRAP